MRRKVDWA